mmetsp:Transcript_39680/g.48323  ORF Transcript_39680/g.48323 Transcript_39680/m.48323 type:complete len:164 (-) Transcript_39680:491-982(-)
MIRDKLPDESNVIVIKLAQFTRFATHFTGKVDFWKIRKIEVTLHVEPIRDTVRPSSGISFVKYEHALGIIPVKIVYVFNLRYDHSLVNVRFAIHLGKDFETMKSAVSQGRLATFYTGGDAMSASSVSRSRVGTAWVSRGIPAAAVVGGCDVIACKKVVDCGRA